MMKNDNARRAFDSDRPNTFAQLVGNQTSLSRITTMIARGRLAKVLFVTGPTGSGKTTLARTIARAILCSGRLEGDYEPCGNCANCEQSFKDTICSVGAFSEYDANCIDEEKLFEIYAYSLTRPDEVVFIDELQDMSPTTLRRFRKLIESTVATLILTTSHPDQIEDAMRNRLKSYEYQLTRPTTDEVVDFLKQRFESLGISYGSVDQLVRVAESLNCEMRPCGEFPRKVLSEAGGELTDKYLDEIFGRQGNAVAPRRSHRRTAV